MKKTILLFISFIWTLLTAGCSSSSSATFISEENHVSTEKHTQSMSIEATSPSILPQTTTVGLIIHQAPSKYTYEDLVHDMNQLTSNYGDIVHVQSLCDTADGRRVYDVVLGNPQGKNQILIFGAMHAREYITTQIVMRQLCDAIDAINGYGGEYRGISLHKLLNDMTIHFVPMNNPDGVAISQEGIDAIRNVDIKNQILAMGAEDYEQWKANGMGVDLNRNFDAGWIEYVGATQPSSERYKGRFPGSEPESAALIALTKNSGIQRAISYHTCGALIYWYYKQSGNVMEVSRSFAQLLSEETGYPLDSDYTAVDAAGYKDWAVYRMGIPSITIEVGGEDGETIENPVPIRRLDNIWMRNKNVLYATAYNLKCQITQ